MRGRQTQLSRFVLALGAVGLALAVWQAFPRARWMTEAYAADKDAPAKAKPKADDDEPAPLDAEHRYKLPDTNDPAELLKFIEMLNGYKPANVEDAIEHQKQAPGPMKAAAERILKVEKDKKSQAYRTASLMLLALRVSKIADAKPAEQHAIIDEIVKRLAVDEPSPDDYGLAMMATRQLDNLEDTKLAAEGYNAIAKAFKKSSDPRVVELGKMFEGVARRIDLVGKPLKLDGQTFGGKPFDWKAYAGKVVLVDFWATWCGPCRAEMPNVRSAYEEYHKRGFDVVGVSIDDDNDALKEFLAKESPPWTTIHDVRKGEENAHPLAEYYGVMGIPTVFLVGKDGNVVSTAARGEELWDQLAKLIGPPSKERPAESPLKKLAKPPAGPKEKGAGK